MSEPGIDQVAIMKIVTAEEDRKPHAASVCESELDDIASSVEADLKFHDRPPRLPADTLAQHSPYNSTRLTIAVS